MSDWTFFNLPNSRALTYSEVNYWKTNLDRILKAGVELELNLKKSKGRCKGNFIACVCESLRQSNCWQECANMATCAVEKEACIGISCSNFVPKCETCDNYTISCLTCEHRFDPTIDPDSVRASLRKELHPSRHYGKVSKYGVHDIVCDGSLLGAGEEGKGLEVITTGRRVDFWAFHKMLSSIITRASSRGAYVNERCSVHIHMLASYYDGPFKVSEFEQPLPNIVLLNLHQLCRKYQNAITWMAAALNSPNYMTRWEKFRQSVLGVSPLSHYPFQKVIDVLADKTGKPGGKYAWVNYMFLDFKQDSNDINKFHVEFRVMDGNKSASCITAFVCLFYAMIIKAVELSRYGIMEVGNANWMKQSLRVKETLLNNCPEGWKAPHRYSRTMLTQDIMTILKEEAMELLYHLKHILSRMGPAYDVLEQLAHKPAAIMRIEGKSWEEIEDVLSSPEPEDSELEAFVNKQIDLRQIVKYENEHKWLEELSRRVAKRLKYSHEDVVALVETRKCEGTYIWASKLGSFIKL